MTTTADDQSWNDDELHNDADEGDLLEMLENCPDDYLIFPPKDGPRYPPRRLVRKKDPALPLAQREIVAVTLFHFARAAARQCPARACRSADICQRPPLKCRLRPCVDLYDWDYELPGEPRRAMYDEITRRFMAGCYTDYHFPRELKRFTPRLPVGTFDETEAVKKLPGEGN